MLNYGYVLAALALIALIPLFFSCCYLFFLSLFSLIPCWPRLNNPTAKFAILIPAHNAEKVIEKTVTDLMANMDYDPELYQVVVIADNCRDSTGYLASFAGAKVIESTNDWKQGKGYALEYAFKELKKQDFDAFLIADVNTVIDKKALKYLDAALNQGAVAMQLPYSLLDDRKTWTKRYADIVQTGINYLRRKGRNRLRLSCGITGNGLCLTKLILEEIPFTGFEKVEGLEYHYKLVLAGKKVWFVPDSEIYGNSLKQSNEEIRKIYDEKREIHSKYQKSLIKASGKGIISALDCLVDFYLPSLKTFFAGLLVIMFSGGLLLTASIWRPDCDELLLISLIITGISIIGLSMIMFYIFACLLERRRPPGHWAAVGCFPLYLIWQFGMNILGKLKSRTGKK